MARHVFTRIAPEDNPDDMSEKYLYTWRWCIRCGVLKLGHKYYVPGHTQTKSLKSYGDGKHYFKEAPPCLP